MELTLSNISTSLVCIVAITWFWRILKWLWLKPKMLEKCLTKQGFRGEKTFVWNGPTPTVIVTNPEEIRKILMKISDFQKTIPNPILKRITNGLTRHEGQKWVQQRKLINPAFHMEKLKQMQSLEQHLEAVFKMEEGCLNFLENIFQSLFIPTKNNKREAKIIKQINTLLKDMIQKRQKAMKEEEETRDDLLGLLLKSNKEGIEQDHHEHEQDSHNKKHVHVKMSLKEVIEECKTFYIAGQETTSTLLVWTLVLLSKHPNWQEQLREEILATFGHNTPSYDGLNQLKKVLRLYPPAPSPTRKLCTKMKVGDAILPEGVQVNLSLVHVHQNEKYWGSDAKEFNPERFSQGILQATSGNMCFFAFGWGPRICIGSNFAMLQVKMALAMILQRFVLELSPSYAHAPTNTRGTLRPQFGANL
ncbi:hypothetical protein RDABS01_033360, partial [Bienertia sinuspersici]